MPSALREGIPTQTMWSKPQMGMAIQDILERKETLLKLNNMNNEEKAKKIAMPCPACSCLWTKDMMYKQEYCKDCVPQDRFTGAMEMAQWKDEQLKEILNSIKDEIQSNLCASSGFNDKYSQGYQDCGMKVMELIDKIFEL